MPSTDQLEKRLLNARADVPDFRDYMYEPALLNLKASLAPAKNLHIRDQGSEGACTGFGLAAVIDKLLVEADSTTNKKRTKVSTRMLYEMARRYDEWEGQDYEGSSCRGAIKGWYNMGVCREQLYPYGDPGAGFSVEAAKDARNHTLGAYYRLGTRISDFHSALQEVGAIYCSADVHNGWGAPDPKTGCIAYDIDSPPPVEGGHAFAIVGYDSKGFWIQNSWGPAWGQKGLALWTYEDWHQNISDAWVFRLALPTPQIWHLPHRGAANAGAIEKRAKPTRAEIAGHFVHVDDGKFHNEGRYWSDLNDVDKTASLVAQSTDYDHILFYAHGGLNSPTASAKRIAAMKEIFKANRIYPFHWMYDTGLLEELKDVVIGRREESQARAGGFQDWIDRFIEKTTRVPGRALWREMKAGAQTPFLHGQAGAQVVNSFFTHLRASTGVPKKIHFAGHSTGMILLSALMPYLESIVADLEVSTVSLMAPAGTTELFTDSMQPYLKTNSPSFRIAEMNIYNLIDELERDDNVVQVYRKSLLYLVSRAFEESIPEKILGMEKYSKAIEKRRGLSRLNVYYSDGDTIGSQVTQSTSHGGFDNDPNTMNHILKRILRKTPARKFTKDDLDF